MNFNHWIIGIGRDKGSVHLRNADRGSCYYATLLIYHQVDVCHSIVVDLGTSFEGIKVRAQETNHDSCVWVNHLRNSQNGWERETSLDAVSRFPWRAALCVILCSNMLECYTSNLLSQGCHEWIDEVLNVKPKLCSYLMLKVEGSTHTHTHIGRCGRSGTEWDVSRSFGTVWLHFLTSCCTSSCRGVHFQCGWLCCQLFWLWLMLSQDQ